MKPIILMMGLNHSTAPVQIREQIELSHCKQPDALAHISSQFDPSIFSEVLVLGTCNRTEVYALVHDEDLATDLLCRLLVGDQSLVGRPNVYKYVNEDAVEHLFAVASGIDSMILGESEILGQVRTAYFNAVNSHTVGPVFHELFKDAIHTGKRSHAETHVGDGPRSVSYAAVASAKQYLGPLTGKRVLIVGAGDMAQRAARILAADGASLIMVTNRTFENADKLSSEIGAQAVHFDQITGSLRNADLVIAATGAPHILIDCDMVRNALIARDEPLVLIDISVPRNISPEAATIPNVILKNIDDLADSTRAANAEREKAVVEVEAIVTDESHRFWKWFVERRAAPTIGKLRDRAEEIRTAELDKALRRLQHLHLSERDRNVISALSNGIVNKLLAGPTAHIKERTSSGDGIEYLSTLSELFDLDPNEHVDLPTT